MVGGAFSSAGGVSGVNNIAVWDGNDWSAIGGGVTDGTPEHLWHSGTPEQVLARVDAIVARGNDVFVAGDFRIAWNGSASVNANYVARARWDTGLQEWNWAGLDGGLTIEPDSAFRPDFAYLRPEIVCSADEWMNMIRGEYCVNL